MVTMIELSLLRYITIDNIYVVFYKTRQLSFINTILIIIFYQHEFYK